ncbi:Di-copper centre-containing protein [Rhizoctonia solani]|uniref:Di-copper centre-containing protein n=1 Tax=Rhizoctonia solani TaxID=456999 RepID=A0A8H7IC95_9AGAM|nr:Di-copper centre-containing protein [Rhizoctonia solani]
MKLASLLSVTALALGVFAADSDADSFARGGNKCRQPAKRKEWRTISRKDRKAFIDAVKCLQKPYEYGKTSGLSPKGDTPGIPAYNSKSSYFDDLVYAHMDSNNKDHFTARKHSMLTRWYLHTFHDALKQRCGYKGVLPYWNWSLDVANMTSAPVFDADPETGLGTFGTPLTDGAFKNSYRAYPTPHVINRTYTPYLFFGGGGIAIQNDTFPFNFPHRELAAPNVLAPDNINAIINGSVGNYTDFAFKIDGVRAQGPHNAAHLMMPGDISHPLWSPNDALFYLHHANIDCIWAKWQSANKKNKEPMEEG